MGDLLSHIEVFSKSGDSLCLFVLLRISNLYPESFILPGLSRGCGHGGGVFLSLKWCGPLQVVWSSLSLLLFGIVPPAEKPVFEDYPVLDSGIQSCFPGSQVVLP